MIELRLITRGKEKVSQCSPTQPNKAPKEIEKVCLFDTLGRRGLF
jgi:hypothetical protein